VKTAPHLGHLIFASFETLAHPKANNANTANNIKMLTHFLITVHLLSSSFKKLQRKRRIPKTDIKNPFLCQAKNINFFLPFGNSLPHFFFFGLAFFVAFFALGFFIPHDFVPHAMGSSPPFLFYIDLFISFKLIFVKVFLMDINI
jgi:hypothetical protein